MDDGLRTPLDIFNFNLLLKKATAVAETSNITFLASVNFLICLATHQTFVSNSVFSYPLSTGNEFPHGVSEPLHIIILKYD